MNGRLYHLVGLVLVLASLAACGLNLNGLNAPSGLYINAITLVGSQGGWAVGLESSKAQPVLLRLQNGAWQRDPAQPPATSIDDLEAIAVNGSTLWIGGTKTDATHGDNTNDSGFVLMRDGTGAWQRKDFGAPVNAIALTGPTEGWAVGGGGAIYHDQAGVWQQVSNDMSNALFTLSYRSPTDVWAAGEEGAVLHYDGKTWQHQDHFTHANLYAIAMSAADGWGGGTDGTMVQLRDGKWGGVATPINVTIRAATFVGETAYVAGDHGAVFSRDVDTDIWTQIKPPIDAQLNAIAVAPNGDIWVGGDTPQDAIYVYSGGSWRVTSIAQATPTPTPAQ